jgi:hypothetical protein
MLAIDSFAEAWVTFHQKYMNGTIPSTLITCQYHVLTLKYVTKRAARVVPRASRIYRDDRSYP